MAQAVEIRGYSGGGDGRNPYVAFAGFLGESYRKGFDIGLRGAVERDAGQGHPHGVGGHVEDVAASRRGHLLRKEATERRHGADMEADDAVNALLVGFDDVVVDEHPCIVHQHFGPDTGLLAGGEETFRRVGQGKVGGIGSYTDTTLSGEFPGTLVEAFNVFGRGENVVAPHGQPAGYGKTDSGAGAGHDSPSFVAHTLFRFHPAIQFEGKDTVNVKKTRKIGGILES